MKYENEMSNEEFENELPRYVADQMNAEERAVFERALSTDADRHREVEELSATANQFRELLAADQQEYALDHERFESLQEAAKRIQPFPKSVRRFRIAAQVAVAAAALLVGAFVGVDQGREQFRYERGLDPIPATEQAMLRSVLEDPSFLYVFPEGYGMDRDDDWRFADSKPERKPYMEQETTHPFSRAVLSTEGRDPSIPYYFGLDGPTPYFPIDTSSWGYI